MGHVYKVNPSVLSDANCIEFYYAVHTIQLQYCIIQDVATLLFYSLCEALSLYMYVYYRVTTKQTNHAVALCSLSLSLFSVPVLTLDAWNLLIGTFAQLDLYLYLALASMLSYLSICPFYQDRSEEDTGFASN